MEEKEQRTETINPKVLNNAQAINAWSRTDRSKRASPCSRCKRQNMQVTEAVNEDVQVIELVENIIEEAAVKPFEELSPVTELEENPQVDVLEQDLQIIEVVNEDIQITEVVEEFAASNELVEAVQAEVAVTEIPEITHAPVQTTDILATEKPVKENIRPFNVLMLKSDKSKMNRIDTMNKLSPIAQKAVPVTKPIYSAGAKTNK